MGEKFILQEGEKDLGSWTINYLPQNKGRYLGKFTITNKRLFFETKFDVSAIGGAVVGLGGAIAAAKAFGLNKAFVTYKEDLININIPKEEIKDIKSIEKFLSKKIIITLKDGSVHTFDYGMLSVKKILEALK